MDLVAPDACSLPTAEQPLRLAEFDDVFGTAVRRVESVGGTRARMHLSGPPGLGDRVRDLAAREMACCSFFSFATTSELAGDVESVALDIEVPPAHIEVLARLVQRAQDKVAR